MALWKGKDKEITPREHRKEAEEQRQKEMLRRRLKLLQYELELLSRKYSP